MSPLVANAGLGAGDCVYLNGTPFDCTAQAANLQALAAAGAAVAASGP